MKDAHAVNRKSVDGNLKNMTIKKEKPKHSV